MIKIKEYRQIEKKLFARIGERNPQKRLFAQRQIMGILGNPEKTYPVVHVTGTNGKSSTCRMIEALLRSHGLHTGLFTSPHLVSITERICINGEPIANDFFSKTWQELAPCLDYIDEGLTKENNSKLSYFETITAMAFLAFANSPVDVAIIEVGMGGHWDATNVVVSDVAVFTPIDLDHVPILGSNISEIAKTKSKIIKPNSTVISAKQHREAHDILTENSLRNNAKFIMETEDFAVLSSLPGISGQMVKVQGVTGDYESFFLPLMGKHQAQNAAVAIAAVESFMGDGKVAISQDVIESSFRNFVNPARIQILSRKPLVVIDVAHNRHSAISLKETIESYFNITKFAFIIGVLEGKDVHGIINAIDSIAAKYFVISARNNRSVPQVKLAKIITECIGKFNKNKIKVCELIKDAFELATEWAKHDVTNRGIVITGSNMNVADVLSSLDQIKSNSS